jgi:hypothetical protein
MTLSAFRPTLADVLWPNVPGLSLALGTVMRENERVLPAPAAPERVQPPALVAPVRAGRVLWTEAQRVGTEPCGRPVKRAAPARRSRAPATRGRTAEGGRGGSGKQPTRDGVEVLYRRPNR